MRVGERLFWENVSMEDLWRRNVYIVVLSGKMEGPEKY